MWPTQQQSKRGRTPAKQPRYRLWALAAIGVFLLIVGTQIVGSLGSSGAPSSDTNTTAAAGATPASSDGGFLSNGYAQLNSNDTSKAHMSSWGLLGGIVLPLLIVIALVYIVLRGLKYFNTRVAATGASSKLLESLDTLSLGQQGSIHLVRVGERVMAVGAGGQQLSLLTELDGEQAQALLAAKREQQERAVSPTQTVVGALGSFREVMQQRLGKHDLTDDLDSPAAAYEPAATDSPATAENEPIGESPQATAEQLATLEALLANLRPTADTAPVGDAPRFGAPSGSTESFPIVPPTAYSIQHARPGLTGR
jgi:flagellar protein FliO/FliZ